MNYLKERLNLEEKSTFTRLKHGKAYLAAEVDLYIEILKKAYTDMQQELDEIKSENENCRIALEDMRKKEKHYIQKIEEYRKTVEELKEMHDEILTKSENHAEELLAQARAKSYELIQRAKEEAREIAAETKQKEDVTM